MATETPTKPRAVPVAEASTGADDALPSPQPESGESKSKSKRKAADADAAALPELEVDLSLPEPPSKRARRALKKGKTLPAKPKPTSDDDEGDASGAADKEKTKKSERSPYGIWIGNLPFTVTRPQLFRWFVDSSGGAIAEADITRVNLPLGKRLPHQHRPHNVHASTAADADPESAAAAAAAPPNKGFAYVDFATYEAQVAAAALSETELDGRRVLIKDSTSFEGRPAKEGSAAAGREAMASGHDGAAGTSAASASAGAGAAAAAASTSTKVFVGNLGFDTTEDDLRRHFAPCGPIAWVKVATFPDNMEKCRGYGWVQFGGAAGKADGKTDDARRLHVTPEVAAEAAAAAVRGFVRIKETVATEADFVAEAAADDAAQNDNDADSGADSASPSKPAAPAHTKTRKWWVNMLKGRPLKVQFAEDDAVRYKKRFGKGRQAAGAASSDASGAARGRPPRPPRPPRANHGGDAGGRPYKTAQDLSIAARTGAIAVSLGKKTSLE